MALPMETCGDTLPPGTPGPGGRDTALPSPARAALEAPELGPPEGQDLPSVSPPSCIVKAGIPSSRRYLLTYLRSLWSIRLFHQKHWLVESKASTRSSRSKQQQNIKRHIKDFTCETCSKFLVAEVYSLCVPVTPCSTTSTPRLITPEGRKNISWTPRTLPRHQRPQWHQQCWHQSPNQLLNLNLRTLYLQCP